MKNFSSITEDLDITTKKYVDDNKVTSIDGLTGGTLTSPLKVTGGDGTSASKIALNQSGNGQITDSGTSTIFGFMSASDLTVGSANYNTRFRGKQTRPTWNGNDLALKSDMPDVSGKANLNGGNTFNGKQIFQNANSGAVAECVMNDSAYDSFTVRNTSDNTKKTAISSGYVWCQDSDNVYSQFKPTGIYYGNDTSGYEGTLAFPTGISGTKTIATTDELSGKANLNGGNTFTGDQQFNGGNYWFNTTNGRFVIEDAGGNAYIAMTPEGLNLDDDDLGNVPFKIASDAGTSGQVLTSQGAGNSPAWTSPAIKSATLNSTTKTLYLTLTDNIVSSNLSAASNEYPYNQIY